MKNSTLTTLIIAGVIGVTALLFINIAPEAPSVAAPQISAVGNVKGMALFHAGIPYTLNFKQQEFTLDALNRSVKVKKSDYPDQKESFAFEKIAIYRFNADDLILTPVGIKEKNLVFSVPAIDSNTYLLELSGGELNTLLNQAFDP